MERPGRVEDEAKGEKVNTISGGFGRTIVACVKLDNIADGTTPVWEIGEYNGPSLIKEQKGSVK